MLDTMHPRTISCLQNTLIYIIIVCKQTSAYHKSSDLPYSKKTRVFLINLFHKNIKPIFSVFIYKYLTKEQKAIPKNLSN